LFIRSMFWWGYFFSSTLQLSGKYKEVFAKRLINAYDALMMHQYFVGVNTDPWNHRFENGNYQKVECLSHEAFTSIVEERAHIKIAAQWPLSEWDTAANKLTGSWKLLVSLIS
ncbi:MAG TPA: hypothetical protein VER36_02355, partial [Flavisolibacter sp.]|nr:hypothetical protein [Flavisolibacter sp.]